jgi:hypothetical protein
MMALGTKPELDRRPRSIGSILLTGAAICALLAGSDKALTAQNPGALNSALPAVQQEKQDAQNFAAKAQRARENMDVIGKALQATVELERAIDRRGTNVGAGSGLGRTLVRWKSLAGTIAGESRTGAVNGRSLAGYTKMTHETAAAVASAPSFERDSPAIDLGPTQHSAQLAMESLFGAYDKAVVEQASANHILRTYPYSELAEQRPVDCDVVNRFSRDLKCLAPSSRGIQTNQAWLAATSINLSEFCRTKELEPFSREQYGAKQVFVRKPSPIAAQLGSGCHD